jgi:hypothetical protein
MPLYNPALRRAPTNVASRAIRYLQWLPAFTSSERWVDSCPALSSCLSTTPTNSQEGAQQWTSVRAGAEPQTSLTASREPLDLSRGSREGSPLAGAISIPRSGAQPEINRVETGGIRLLAIVRGMSNGAQLIQYAGSCALCNERISTSVQPGVSLLDSAQDAALTHLRLVHSSMFELLPVASIGQLVASIGNTFA